MTKSCPPRLPIMDLLPREAVWICRCWHQSYCIVLWKSIGSISHIFFIQTIWWWGKGVGVHNGLVVSMPASHLRGWELEFCLYPGYVEPGSPWPCARKMDWWMKSEWANTTVILNSPIGLVIRCRFINSSSDSNSKHKPNCRFIIMRSF